MVEYCISTGAPEHIREIVNTTTSTSPPLLMFVIRIKHDTVKNKQQGGIKLVGMFQAHKCVRFRLIGRGYPELTRSNTAG